MATVEIICPHCNRKQKVADHRLAETVYCLVCQQLITDVYLYKVEPPKPELSIKLKGRLVSEFGTTKLEDLKSRSDEYTGKFEPVDEEQEDDTALEESNRLFDSGMYAAVPESRRKLSTAAKTYLTGGAILLALATGVTVLGVTMLQGDDAKIDTLDIAGQEGTRTEKYDNGQIKAEWHVTQLGGEGVPDGVWREWHETGEKKLQGTYALGNKVGEWIGWHTNGQQSLSAHYVAGRESGTWTEWHANGRKSLEGDYVDGAKDGDWRTWYPSGAFETVERYDKGEPVGQWVVWFEDGARKTHGEYKDGLREGFWVTHHDNTVEELSEVWHRGLLDGETYGFYRNRQQRFRGQWTQGKRVGEWTWWHTNGNEAKKGSYQDGAEQGVWKEWHAGGALKSRGSYEAGQRVGEWRWYEEDGSVAIVRGYDAGRMTTEQYFFRDTEVEYKKTLNEDGTLRSDWTVIPGATPVRHGYERVYYPDGSLKSQGVYIKGLKEGAWRSWDEVGNLTEATTFRNGQPVE
ncbi:MAG: hypothetical protein R3E76_17240 [Planctomycetota bacterium]